MITHVGVTGTVAERRLKKTYLQASWPTCRQARGGRRPTGVRADAESRACVHEEDIEELEVEEQVDARVTDGGEAQRERAEQAHK